MSLDGYDSELSCEGFQRLVSDLYKQGGTLEQVYERAELEHEKAFLKRRYTSFESFKVIRYRYLKKESKHCLPVPHI